MWVGKTLFVPPIVKICQTLKITNHAFANTVTFANMLLLFFSIFHDWHWNTAVSFVFGFILAVMMGLLCLYWMLIAGLEPEMRFPVLKVFLVFRMMSFFMLLQHAMAFVLLGKVDISNAVYWFLLLVCDYARMIDRIPPKEKKVKKTSAKLSKEMA